MILSDIDIKKSLSSGDLNIFSNIPLYIGPSSVDLTLSPFAEIFIPGFGENIDTKNDNRKMFTEHNFSERGYLKIYPGEFYLLSTNETIVLNKKMAAFVHGRSSLARLGLNIHLAGFIDPQFSGTITMEVSNFTQKPIVLYPNMRICQIVFMKTSSEVEIGYGEKSDRKYQGQEKPGLSKIHEDKI